MHEREQSHFHNCTASEGTEKKMQKGGDDEFPVCNVTAEDTIRPPRHTHTRPLVGGATTDTSAPRPSHLLNVLSGDGCGRLGEKEPSMHAGGRKHTPSPSVPQANQAN